MLASISEMQDTCHDRQPVDITSTSAKPKRPDMFPAAASSTVMTMLPHFAPFSDKHVKSTTETSGLDKRKAMFFTRALAEGRS